MAALRELVGWLYLLPAIAGVIVCMVHLGSSRWMPLLTGAFVGQTVVLLFYRLTGLAMRVGGMRMASLEAAYLFAALLGVAAQAALVAGLAGLLAERWPTSRAVPRADA